MTYDDEIRVMSQGFVQWYYDKYDWRWLWFW